MYAGQRGEAAIPGAVRRGSHRPEDWDCGAYSDNGNDISLYVVQSGRQQDRRRSLYLLIVRGDGLFVGRTGSVPISARACAGGRRAAADSVSDPGGRGVCDRTGRDAGWSVPAASMHLYCSKRGGCLLYEMQSKVSKAGIREKSEKPVLGRSQYQGEVREADGRKSQGSF